MLGRNRPLFVRVVSTVRRRTGSLALVIADHPMAFEKRDFNCACPSFLRGAYGSFGLACDLRRWSPCEAILIQRFALA